MFMLTCETIKKGAGRMLGSKAGSLRIEAITDEGKTFFEFYLESEDGKSITPQDIIDTISTYLIMDPLGIFTDRPSELQ